MDWILILVIAMQGSPQLVTTTIGGHSTKTACMATLENAKREATNHFGLSPEAAREMFKRSFCVQKGSA